MASLFEGYEYDIFISYRQKDNKGDRWVSEFVDALKTELESTFKEEICVYFDINPHDGLLETHDVDASLKDKLKCLVFIPIISRTYCDPKSFAWEHELVAFNKLAKKDKLGRDIKLVGGNVASRILPVKIHDLDLEDKSLLENELGGFIRGIEFIYKEPGVNRPLKPEDDEKKNLNNTVYRNQINKVANAVKEIITALRKHDQQNEKVPKEVIVANLEQPKKLKIKIIIASFFILALIVSGYFLISKQLKFSKSFEKSIAVLPFRNDSPNDSTTYFMDGVMEEVLNNLQSIKDLRVISRNSVEQYRNNTAKSTPEIAKALGVNYIVEGSGQKYGNSFRLRVQLIKAAKEGHLWGKSYEKEIKDAKDIFSIQSEIAQAIANQLEAVITPQEKQLIEKTHTTNLEAYDAFLKGEFYRKKVNQNDLETALKYYKIALEKDPDYAQVYCGIVISYAEFQEMGYLSPSEVMPKMYAAIMTAMKLDSTLADVHDGLANYYNAKWDWNSSESEFQKAIRINPNYADARSDYSIILSRLGRTTEAMEQIGLALKLSPYDLYIKGTYGFDLLWARRFNEAISVSREVLKIDSTNTFALNVLMFAFHLTGRYDEALEPWKKSYYIAYPGFVHAFDQGYAKAGYFGALRLEADTLLAQSRTKYVNPGDIAYLYVSSDNRERALDCWERAFDMHDINIGFLTMAINDSLRNEPRYQALCRKMNLPIK
jgi:TolB-like protein